VSVAFLTTILIMPVLLPLAEGEPARSGNGKRVDIVAHQSIGIAVESAGLAP
jgi:hypothetical protein